MVKRSKTVKSGHSVWLPMWRGHVRGLAPVFAAATSCLLLLIYLAPTPKSGLFVPITEEDLIRFADDIDFYSYKHHHWSLLLFSTIYVYIQSFCLPGTFLMVSTVYCQATKTGERLP